MCSMMHHGPHEEVINASCCAAPTAAPNHKKQNTHNGKRQLERPVRDDTPISLNDLFPVLVQHIMDKGAPQNESPFATIRHESCETFSV